MLISAKNCVWAVEQPRGSILATYKRFDWMKNHVMWDAWPETQSSTHIRGPQCNVLDASSRESNFEEDYHLL